MEGMEETKNNIIKWLEKKQAINKTEDSPALKVNNNTAQVLFENKTKITEDGFQEVSPILGNSDVSDKSGLPGYNKTENIQSKADNSFNKKDIFTDDGFRVVSSIPEDDSDVSDAFNESDFSEDETENVQLKPNKLQTDLICSVKTNIKDVETFEPINNSINSMRQDDNTVSTLSMKKKKKKKRNKKKKKKQQEVLSEDTCNATSSKVQDGHNNKELVHVDISASDNVASQQSKKKKKKKKKQPVILSKEEEEIIKSRFPVKYHKVIEEFGLNWADLESPAAREKRELSKLPQPKQIPNCNVYLKKCKVTGKVITMYDYSIKRSAARSEETSKLISKSTTPNEQEIKDTRQQLKMEHLQELRGIKRKLNTEVVSKTLDPREKDRQLLALVEKLGGPKVKKPYVNYKILQEQKKQEKQKIEADREKLKDLGMHDLLQKKKRKRRKRDPNSVAGFNSMNGRFRDGVRIVTKRDLENINGSKKT